MGLRKTIYSSAARTATPTAITFNMGQRSKMRVFLDATAITSTPSVVVTVDVQDPTSGKFMNVLTASAITAVSSTALALIDGLTGLVKVTVTHGNANSITYTVGALLTD
jgi:hypothetical protein